MDYKNYTPSERFAALSDSPLARAMWECLTKEENIKQMEAAIAKGEAPVIPLDSELHEKFSKEIEASHADSDELRTLCMNMMKQLLEKKGYRHTACALVPQGNFVRSAGLFERL